MQLLYKEQLLIGNNYQSHLKGKFVNNMVEAFKTYLLSLQYTLSFKCDALIEIVTSDSIYRDAIVSRDNNPYINFQTGYVPIPSHNYIETQFCWC